MNNKRKQRIARRFQSQNKTVVNHIESEPAKASQYIHWLKKYYREHTNIVAILYNRESSYPQDHKQNHDTHEKILRRACEKLGISIARFYCETCSGKMLNGDRKALLKAVRKAQAKIKKGKHAIILATSSDRYLRNKDFHTKDNPDVLPTESEFKKFQKLTCSVPLVTILPPDMLWKKVRGRQSKWGQRVKGNKGGRPILKRPGYKKRLREKELTNVDRLLRQGKNPTEISRKLKIAPSTIRDWIDKYI